QVSFNWTVSDTTAPDLTSPDDQTNNEGDPVSVQVGVSDADTVTADGLPSGLAIDDTGLISGTIDPRAEGSYSVTVTATDNGVQSLGTLNWRANATVKGCARPCLRTNNEGAGVNVQVGVTDGDTVTASGLPAGLS